MTHSSGELQKGWEGLDAGTEDEEAEVSVAGRIMARRVFGKLAFFNMQVRCGAGGVTRGGSGSVWRQNSQDIPF